MASNHRFGWFGTEAFILMEFYTKFGSYMVMVIVMVDM